MIKEMFFITLIPSFSSIEMSFIDFQSSPIISSLNSTKFKLQISRLTTTNHFLVVIHVHTFSFSLFLSHKATYPKRQPSEPPSTNPLQEVDPVPSLPVCISIAENPTSSLPVLASTSNTTNHQYLHSRFIRSHTTSQTASAVP